MTVTTYIESRVVAYQREQQADQQPTPVVIAMATTPIELGEQLSLTDVAGYLTNINENAMNLYRAFVDKTNDIKRVLEGREIREMNRDALVQIVSAIDAGKVRLISAKAIREGDDITYITTFRKL